MLLSRSLSHLILTLHLHFNASFAGKEKCMHLITEFITSDCSKLKHIKNKSILRMNVQNQSEGRSASAPPRHRGWAGLLKDHRSSWLQDYACGHNPGVITVLRDAWLNFITVKRRRCVQGPWRASKPVQYVSTTAVVYRSGGRCSSAWFNHECFGYCANAGRLVKMDADAEMGGWEDAWEGSGEAHSARCESWRWERQMIHSTGAKAVRLTLL